MVASVPFRVFHWMTDIAAPSVKWNFMVFVVFFIMNSIRFQHLCSSCDINLSQTNHICLVAGQTPLQPPPLTYERLKEMRIFFQAAFGSNTNKKLILQQLTSLLDLSLSSHHMVFKKCYHPVLQGIPNKWSLNH